MEFSFDLIVQIMLAYFQVAMALVGAIILLVGGSSFLSIIQRKKSNRRWVNATVVAIREGEGIADDDGSKSKFYYPIFEADDGNGQRMRYECRFGSNDINKFQVGKRARIAPLENSPGFAETEDANKTDVILGVVLCLIGSALISAAVLFIKVTSLSYVVWILTIAYLGFKFKKYIKPKHLRETVDAFRNRKSREEMELFQKKPIITQEYIQEQNKQFEYVGGIVSKIAVLAGFAIMVVGGLGYNSQLEFIENARMEVASPCAGVSVGEDCRRTVLLQDAWSVLPLAVRPKMEGVYVSNDDASRVIVNYGSQTPVPYFVIMGFGALIAFQSSRRTKKI